MNEEEVKTPEQSKQIKLKKRKLTCIVEQMSNNSIQTPAEQKTPFETEFIE